MKSNVLNFSNFTNSEKVIALCHHLDIEITYNDNEEACGNQDEIDEISESSYDDSIFGYGRKEFAVYTDPEADAACSDWLDDYIDECVLSQLPDGLRFYFNSELYKDDCIGQDGRGHILSSYDGSENEETVNGVTYYIYRRA